MTLSDIAEMNAETFALHYTFKRRVLRAIRHFFATDCDY
jgi:hypothetical protein